MTPCTDCGMDTNHHVYGVTFCCLDCEHPPVLTHESLTYDAIVREGKVTYWDSDDPLMCHTCGADLLADGSCPFVGP